jgi:hypothetical protein
VTVARRPLRAVIAVPVIALVVAGCAGCTQTAEPPTRQAGPAPSEAEVRSLLGAKGGAADRVAGDRAVVTINVTPLVTGASPTPGPADLDKTTIVAACALSKQSGGPHGFAVGVMPTDVVTPAEHKKAMRGDYRSLLGANCAGQ